MFPLFPHGTLLYFSAASPPAVGDLVVFLKPKGLICHRLVALNRGQATTWGDWNSGADVPQPVAALLGRCVFVVRKGQVLDMDWPVMQALNRLAAAALPAFKRLLFHVESGMPRQPLAGLISWLEKRA